MKTTVACALLLFSASTISDAQWEWVSGHIIPGPYTVAMKGAAIFVGASNGIHCSTDRGVTWEKVYEADGYAYPQLRALPNSRGDTSLIGILMGGGEVLSSSDNGLSWTSIDDSLPWGYSGTSDITGLRLRTGASLWFASTDSGVYMSGDDGETWEMRNAGLPRQPWDSTRTVPVRTVTAVEDDSGNVCLFAMSTDWYRPLGRSTDGGEHWIPMSQPWLGWNEFSGIVAVPSAADPVLLAWGGSGDPLFRSTDLGTTWQSFLDSALGHVWTVTVDASEGLVYAGTTSGLFRSSDAGETWIQVNSLGSDMVSVYARGQEVFQALTEYAWRWREEFFLMHSDDFGTDPEVLLGRNFGSVCGRPTASGVFHLFATGSPDAGVKWSTDAGATWMHTMHDLRKEVPRVVESDGRIDGAIFAITYAGVFHSLDGGQSWVADTAGLNGAWIDGFAFSPVEGTGPYVFARGYNGISSVVWGTEGPGSGWTQCIIPSTSISHVTVLPDSESTVLAFGNEGVYRSTDGGDTWVLASSNLPYVSSSSVRKRADGTIVVLVATSSTVFRSLNAGSTWTPASAGLYGYVEGLRYVADSNTGKGMHVAMMENGIFVSRNDGVQWFNVTGDLLNREYFYAMDVLHVGTDLLAFVNRPYGDWYEGELTSVYRAPIADILRLVSDSITVFSPAGGEEWFAGASAPIRWNSGLADSVTIDYSTDNGSTWIEVERGLPAYLQTYPWMLPNTPSSSGKVRITDAANPADTEVSSGLFSISHDAIADFISGVSDTSLASMVRHLQSYGERSADGPNADSVAAWIASQFTAYGLSDVVVDTFLVSGNVQKNVVASVAGTDPSAGEIIIGGHHDSVTGPGADDNASGTAAVLEMARVLVASGYRPRATVRFITFAAEELGLLGSSSYAGKARAAGRDIRFMQNYDMIGNLDPYRGDRRVNVVWYDNARVEASLDSLMKRRYTSLTPVITQSYYYASDSYSFYQNGYKAVFNIESDLTSRYHTASDSAVYIDFVYASEIVRSGMALLVTMDKRLTGAEEEPQVPTETALSQNYPNPFNPATVISYTVAAPSELRASAASRGGAEGPARVRLSVYDLLGREVAVLVNEEKPAGVYTVRWDAAGMPSGVYFYTLRSGSFVETKRMILTR